MARQVNSKMNTNIQSLSSISDFLDFFENSHHLFTKEIDTNLNGCVLFQIEDVGISWKLTLTKGQLESKTFNSLELSIVQPSDCTLIFNHERDFLQMVKGELSPFSAWRQNSLRYQGNIKLLRQLQPILQRIGKNLHGVLPPPSSAPTTDPKEINVEEEKLMKCIQELDIKVEKLTQELKEYQNVYSQGESIFWMLFSILGGFPTLFIGSFLSWGIYLLFYNWQMTFVLWFLALFLYALTYFHYFAMLRRRFIIYKLGFLVFSNYKIMQIRCQSLDLDYATVLKNQTHIHQAERVYQHILQLGGFWLKLGQYLSSRADVIPQPYITRLSKLQDSLPHQPFEIVKQTIETELKLPLMKIFEQFEEIPIASASIAQVHVAYLKSSSLPELSSPIASEEIVTSEEASHDDVTSSSFNAKNDDSKRMIKVAVKVQHPKIASMIQQDLIDLKRVMHCIAWLDKQYDFRPVIEEYSIEMAKETDFTNEMKNIQEITECFANNKDSFTLPVCLPECYRQYSTKKVLTMKFIEGVRITDHPIQTLQEKNQVMEAIIQAFSYQIFVQGHFNADPHPGNILIVPKNHFIHLIDFGLCKRLPNSIRLAFGKMIYSACSNDMGSLLDSLEEMGFKFNRDVGLQEMEDLQYLFRDTLPSNEARKQFLALQKERKKKKRNKNIKTPVEAWPIELVFFTRTMFLIRGLSSNIGARLPILSIMGQVAKNALTIPSTSLSLISWSYALTPLEMKIQMLMEKYQHEKKVLGAQVCVYSSQRKIIDAVVGTMSVVDQRLVSESTLFNCYQIGQGILTIALLRLIRDGALNLSNSLSTYLPHFPFPHILLKDFMQQTHIVDAFVPQNFSIGNKTKYDDPNLQQQQPIMNTIAYEFWYLHFTWGWIVEELIEKVSGLSFHMYLKQNILDPLLLSKDIYFGDHAMYNHVQQNSASSCIDLKELGLMKGNGITKNVVDWNEMNSTDPMFPNLPNHQKYLLDPRTFNSHKLRKTNLYSGNCLATARGIARLYSSLTNLKNSEALPYHQVSSIVQNVRKIKLFSGNETTYGLGHRIYQGRKKKMLLFGNHGVGGSMVVCDPQGSFVLCILVNQLDIPNEFTQNLVHLISKELKIDFLL